MIQGSTGFNGVHRIFREFRNVAIFCSGLDLRLHDALGERDFSMPLDSPLQLNFVEAHIFRITRDRQ